MKQLENILNQISNLKETFEVTEIVDSNWEKKYWQKLRLEWNHGSNSIEGNTLTYDETVSLILKDITTGLHEFREYEEIKAHDLAIYDIKKWSKEERLISETDICNLNKTILVRDFFKEAITLEGNRTKRIIQVGKYKNQPNSVLLSNGEYFNYCSPLETPIKMRELMVWFNENQDTSPLILAAEFHHKFILIHPFDDGNGRVSRLLVNYILMKNGLPAIVIKKEHKKEYLLSLRLADAGNIKPFISFLGERLIWSLELGIKAKQGRTLDELGDWKKKLEALSFNLEDEKISKKNRLINNYNNLVLPFLKQLDFNIKTIEEKLFSNNNKSNRESYYLNFDDSINYIETQQNIKIKKDLKDYIDINYRLENFNNSDQDLIIRISANYKNKVTTNLEFIFQSLTLSKEFDLERESPVELADQLSNNLITFIESCKKEI